MKLPQLNEISLNKAMPGMLNGATGMYITMNVGQWDMFLQVAYEHGHTLIELDGNEYPVRAYRKKRTIY